jgi:hypothetical protein
MDVAAVMTVLPRLRIKGGIFAINLWVIYLPSKSIILRGLIKIATAE